MQQQQSHRGEEAGSMMMYWCGSGLCMWALKRDVFCGLQTIFPHCKAVGTSKMSTERAEE
jgi:hypothetical protein